MILVKLGWMNEEKYKSLDWEQFKKYWPTAQETKPENSYSLGDKQARLTYEEAASLAALGVPMEIEPLPGAMLVKMREAWEGQYRSVSAANLGEGKVIQISVPDHALMLIDEVKNLDDCCTDLLQDHINEGWRILAVCPPNAQRRPDYILGRRTKADPFDRSK